MQHLRLLFLQAALLYTGVHAQTSNGTQSQEIQWGPCQITGTLPLVCGNISVPLDYSSPNSTETLTIELIKASDTTQPSKGSILINFGGPGASGQELLASYAAQLQATTGNYYDLVSFDPRGAGKTIPFNCYQNDTERLTASLLNPYVNGNSSDTTLGRLWASGENFAAACQANGGETGELIGFAFIARDMIRIVDALGDEDGLLRYYGLSAGTVLGATLAAMFPDRMDRVVLDGVWNIHEYNHYHGVEGFADTDKTFSGFLSACIAAGENCALSHLNSTAPDIEEAVYELIEHVKYHPIPYQGSLIDYTIVRNVIFLSLSELPQWPSLASFLDALLTGNTTELDAVYGSLSTGEDQLFSEHRFGIQCGDKPARASHLAEVLPVIDQLSKISRIAGDRITYDVDACSQWKINAKERYLGDFRVSTKHPVLIIGNTFDPVTPLVSARNASHSLLGSVVLQHDGFGHTSVTQPSLCTAKTIQTYFVNGTLPEPGSLCEVDVPPFSDLTWQDVLL